MRIPEVFIPEKDLGNKVKQLLEHEGNNRSDNIYMYSCLKILEIEHKPHGEYAYFFDQSLERLRNSGYERHFTPPEIFGLIIKHLEDNLEKNLEGSVKAMLKNGHTYGYWLSIAVSREEDKLVCYTNPKNLRKYDQYPDYRHEGSTLLFDDELRFDVKGIPSKHWTDLRYFNEDFIEFFYSRKFKDLPKIIQEGKVYLPPENAISPGILWMPINSRRHESEFNLSLYELGALSRGVRTRK